MADITKDIRTEIEVKIPAMVIALPDLVFLKKLADGERNCYDRKAQNKLLFLGLVAEGETPPCSKEVAEWEKNQVEYGKLAMKALNKKDWNGLYNAANYLQRHRPIARKGLIVTEAGMRLLKKGTTTSATVKTRGC